MDYSTSIYPSFSPAQLFQQIDLKQPPDTIFKQVLPLLGEALQCDRVFLYLRSPNRHVGRVPFCWRRNDDISLVYDPDWQPEPRWLPRQDPMFAAALRTQPSLFIEDVELADPDVVNRNFERQTFGHRALIHAHLCKELMLWGILQACVFDHPRRWSQADRRLTKQTVRWLTPLAKDYVTHDC